VPSSSFEKFEQNKSDVDRLLAIHLYLAGGDPGRKRGVEPLNKSAIVLITAIWEAYVEDIIAELLSHLVTCVPSANLLPKELRKRIAAEIKKDLREDAPWDLADNGWRDLALSRLEPLQEERNWGLKTPNAKNVNEYFSEATGLKSISSQWRWAGMSSVAAVNKLDSLLLLRGAIAHRSASTSSVKKVHVEDYFQFVQRLVVATDRQANKHAKSICSPLF
jgi:RiboL-PSP-HEPN